MPVLCSGTRAFLVASHDSGLVWVSWLGSLCDCCWTNDDRPPADAAVARRSDAATAATDERLANRRCAVFWGRVGWLVLVGAGGRLLYRGGAEDTREAKGAHFALQTE